MDFSNKKPKLGLILLFFLFVFIITIRPLYDFDIWFHLKSGQAITQLGLIHHDVFSFTAFNREWIPYEWLFQVTVYLVEHIFGLEAIKYLIALVMAIQIGFLYLIVNKVLKLNYLLSIFVSFYYLASIYNLYTARPHVFAYTFLIINLFLILRFIYLENIDQSWTKNLLNRKTLLIFTVPITLAWANLHGSIFLDIAFFGAYAFLCLIFWLIKKEDIWKTKGITLSFYTVLTAVLTVLPPLGIDQYRLLWMFYKNSQLITKFIDEWSSLEINSGLSLLFLGSIIVILGLLLAILIKEKKRYLDFLWLIPLLPFLIFPYIAVRNLYIGYIALAIILAFALARIKISKLPSLVKYLFIMAICAVTALNFYILHLKSNLPKYYYPVQATQFIKTQHLKGNMFNEYGYGGYLLYNLYPEQKVFIDGRTDIYLCCEMRDTLEIALKKFQPDEQFKNFIYQKIYDKYQISYVILRTEKHSLLRKITKLLNEDPNWSLVFWDDNSQIFIRKDGRNDNIIAQFGTQAATPYLRDPYRKDSPDQAMLEYLKMDQVAKSAHTSNAIGFILLQKGQFDNAKIRFEEAIKLDPTVESAYMNLAELYAKDKNYHQAILLYQTAQKIAPDRGLIYIRLGQLFLQNGSGLDQTKKIWQTGVENTVDEDAKSRLKELLQKAG